MNRKFNTVIIGGGCLGCACAFSIQNKLGKKAGNVAIVEKKVLAAGLSSRHSAIVRSANTSASAAKMAKLATRYWQNLKPIWQVEIPYEKPGAIWIAPNQSSETISKWQNLEALMHHQGIVFSQLANQEGKSFTADAVNITPEETCYYEPEVLQLDSQEILQALQNAVAKNRVDVFEHCQVKDFELDSRDQIKGVHTSQGKIFADHFINASGGWSSQLFAGIGVDIPVALEPVYAANFLVSSQEIPHNLPIIADFVNRAYFRRWRGSILHMHQPRSRIASDIARSFSRAVMNPAGADIIYDASSFYINHQQLENYVEKVQNRFPQLGRPVFAGGFQSYFDITPDLKFILGPDSRLTNLYHCLGAGQSLKYAPVFGELMAGMVTDNPGEANKLDIEEFSIVRFSEQPIGDIVTADTGVANSL